MRESGILMHITSLPGPYGIGTMGKSAYDFVDFLRDAGQHVWQVLPLSPTGYGDSPYQSCSAFAGNIYLIDLPFLIEEGLLTQQEVSAYPWCTREDRVDFGLMYAHRLSLLRLAYDRFRGDSDFDIFSRENSFWLPDYALYMALKTKSGGKPWYDWEDGLKFRDPDAIWSARQSLKDEIRFHSFLQFLFHRQWHQLRSYARKQGVRIIGDVPIYVPYDSADVWSNPEWFQLDNELNPTAVAGCPPDAFSQDGQLWGNPLYRWDLLKKDGYRWWIQRLSAAAKLYDRVRLDHFRGFAGYWSVPYGHTTAKNGHWVSGPGLDFIKTVQKELPQLNLIAEDLGYLTPDVLELRDAGGFPGMKVLTFAFDSREPSDYLPHRCIPNSVCYTGTHDNMTTLQWLNTAAADTIAYATEYMHLTDVEGLVWGVIRTAFSTVCDLCIVPMQDYLNLGGEARMNFPGTQSCENWTWRAAEDYISPDLAKKIYGITQLYDRLGKDAPDSPTL